MLPVGTPFGARLAVHAAAGVGVGVRHLRVVSVRGVLPVGISRTRRRNGRIYRHIAVRIGRVGLMATPILVGQGRTGLLLGHGSSGAGTACRRVRGARGLFWEGSCSRNRGIHAVLRGRCGRGGIAGVLANGILRGRSGFGAFRMGVANGTGIGRWQTCLRVLWSAAFHRGQDVAAFLLRGGAFGGR